MLLLPLALVAGAGAALVLGGSVGRLANVPVRRPALALAAAAGQAALPVVPGAARFPVVVASYAAAAVWLGANARGRPPGVQVAGTLLALGWLLNAVVIAANGGMPVSRAALASTGGDTGTAAIESTALPKHLAGTEGRRLAALGDVIAVPRVGVVSVGDVVLAAGLAIAVFSGMQPGGRRPGPSPSREALA